jgi:DNA-binding phage protein
MALTREYRETVVERIKKDPKFTAALYAEAISSLIEGDKGTVLSILRDLVHAHISFTKLSEQTGMDEKSLHRMLGSNGNPAMENLVQLIHIIERDLKLDVNVSVRMHEKNGTRKTRLKQPVLAYA